MKLPANWKNIEGKEYGDYKNIEPGGYICRITEVEEASSRSGRDMFVISFDIAEGDYKDYYKQQYEANSSSDKKWRGVYCQLTDGNSVPYFKGLITAIEKSNNNFVFNGDEGLLSGKFFGGIFGEEEYTKQDGSLGTISKLCFIVSTERVRSGDFSIPKKKVLLTPSGANGLFPPPTDDDEDVLF